MLIAAFRLGTALAGKAVSYEEDKGFWVTGAGQVTPEYVLELDDKGELDWASDEVRTWIREVVLRVPAGGAKAAPSAAVAPDAEAPAGPVAPEDRGDVSEPPSVVILAPHIGEEAPEADAPLAVDAEAHVAERGLPAAPMPAAKAPAEPAFAGAPGPKKPPRPKRAPVQHPDERVPAEEGPPPSWHRGWLGGWRAVVLAAAAAAGVIVLIVVVSRGASGTSGEWAKVASSSGSATLTSESFELVEGQHKLDYTTQRTQTAGDASYNICVVPVGTPADKETDYSVVSNTLTSASGGVPDEGTIVFQRPPGMYVIKVFAANCTWTAAVWEQPQAK